MGGLGVVVIVIWVSVLPRALVEQHRVNAEWEVGGTFKLPRSHFAVVLFVTAAKVVAGSAACAAGPRPRRLDPTAWVGSSSSSSSSNLCGGGALVIADCAAAVAAGAAARLRTCRCGRPA